MSRGKTLPRPHVWPCSLLLSDLITHCSAPHSFQQHPPTLAAPQASLVCLGPLYLFPLPRALLLQVPQTLPPHTESLLSGPSSVKPSLTTSLHKNCQALSPCFTFLHTTYYYFLPNKSLILIHYHLSLPHCYQLQEGREFVLFTDWNSAQH